jgi:hypothetical protein
MADVNGDLPSTPRTPQELYQKVSSLLGQFSTKIKTTKATKLFIKNCERRYGAKVRLVFYNMPLCQNQESGLEKYILQDSILRIKTDADIEHLEAFLASQFEIWRPKDIDEKPYSS